MSEYYVYVITNPYNGKRYVGQTQQDPQKRWNYGAGYHYNTDFYNDILKYKWCNFEKEWDIYYSKEEADAAEDYYINYYHTLNPECGYNKVTNLTLKQRQKEIFRQRALDAEKRWLEKQNKKTMK